QLMLTIQSIAQPLIAKVHGLGTAAGCQLAATCDLAVAATSARFATPGVRLGLFCVSPMVSRRRARNPRAAMRTLRTGEPRSAAGALAHGLVPHVVPADELDSTVSAVAQQVASASAATVAIGKRAFYEQLELSTEQAYAKMSDVMATNAVMHDAQEGIGAFLEKRDRVWRHRQA